ncbi:MAG: periplasmic heavy metal sensor [Myxococcota bacterium]
MFFFLLGALSLAGFFKVLLRPHRGRRGWGRHRWRRGLHRAFAYLDTSPGQEKEIRHAIEDFMNEAIPLRRSLRRNVRGRMAELLEEESLDEEQLEAHFSEEADQLRALKEQWKKTLTRIHTALDADQRERMARWLGRFGGRVEGMPMGGPYR